MAGSISAATAAAIIGAGAAVGGTAYGIYNGQKQQAVQKQSLANQNQAQQTAEANALNTQRQGEIAQNAANQQTPNVSAILARAATMGNSGLSSTMLTGPSGVNTNNLNLGKTTLLGG